MSDFEQDMKQYNEIEAEIKETCAACNLAHSKFRSLVDELSNKYADIVYIHILEHDNLLKYIDIISYFKDKLPEKIIDKSMDILIDTHKILMRENGVFVANDEIFTKMKEFDEMQEKCHKLDYELSKMLREYK